VNALQVGEPNPLPTNPFSYIEGSPEIMIKYDNSTFKGELRASIFTSGDVNDNMPSLEDDLGNNITSIIPSNTINISTNKQIELLVTGNPQPELQPSSVSASVYLMNGTAVGVLSVEDKTKNSIFDIDLMKGQYLIIATATWLPNPDTYLTTSGYVSYVFRVVVE
jgi:hypothetical protein